MLPLYYLESSPICAQCNKAMATVGGTDKSIYVCHTPKCPAANKKLQVQPFVTVLGRWVD